MPRSGQPYLSVRHMVSCRGGAAPGGAPGGGSSRRSSTPPLTPAPVCSAGKSVCTCRQGASVRDKGWAGQPQRGGQGTVMLGGCDTLPQQMCALQERGGLPAITASGCLLP